MFEVGKVYVFGMWEPGQSGAASIVEQYNCEVVKVDLPLVTISHGSSDKTIINTHSPAFAWARLQK